MHYKDLDDFLTKGQAYIAKGPIALIFIEDETEIVSTLHHHVERGFKSVIAFVPNEISIDTSLAKNIVSVGISYFQDGAVQSIINRMIAACDGLWMYYCFNAEYLFYPFCETRSVGELLTFHTEERRDAMLAFVVDLYADDLDAFPNAVSIDRAHLDRTGYYALGRPDPDNHNHPKERQLDFFGGLRWRFEEHVPAPKRKIDRIALFKAKQGLEWRPDHTFNDSEYNTYTCPWHNNLTASICSFRTAKALKRNPGSRFEINKFTWHNSTSFEWNSRQLLDLGLMEPGQWF